MARDPLPARAQLVVRGPYRRARRLARLRYTWALQRVPRGALPSSWEDGPPDYVGIGAQKAGTSWWCGAIQAHPEVHQVPGAPKETHFFEFYADSPLSERSVGRYHRLFPRPAGTITGEWTPDYMHQAETPAMLKAAAPEARLIAMLRDPIDRYRSALTIADLERLRPGTAVEDAFRRGLYFAQLSRVLEHFDRDRLLVLQYERCLREPEPELRRTYAFLGLGNVEFVPPSVGSSNNATLARKVPMDVRDLQSLRDRYNQDAQALVAEFPEIDPALWRTLAL